MIDLLFDKYKIVTEKILNRSIRIEDIPKFMLEREKILKEIESENISGKIIKESYIKHDLERLDNKLEKKLNKELLEVKDLIKNTRVRKKAFTTYSNSNYNGNLFTKKV